MLLVNDEFLELLTSIRPRLTKVERIVVMSDNDSFVLPADHGNAHYEDMLAKASPDFEFPDFDENTQATTFYTSGTTGAPKGVYFSHRQMVLHTLGVLTSFGVAPKQGRFHSESVYMPITPMFHVHAWGFPYAATAVGAKQVYPGRYLPDLLLKLIKNEGVTFTHCVPTILLMMLDAKSSVDVNLSGLTMVIGGAALPKALALRAMSRGIDIFTGYGMSETGPILTLAHLKASMLTGDPDEEVEFRTKTGRPSPLVDIRIVDSEMRDVAHDGKATGEIVARAPWLTQGYYKNPEASEALWQGGYLHTNDIANLGPNGYLQITDRIKDVIKTGGEWVSSLELEDIIMHAPGGKRSRRHWNQGREMGRTSDGPDRSRQSGDRHARRKCDQGARRRIRGQGRHFEIWRAANHSLRRPPRTDERGASWTRRCGCAMRRTTSRHRPSRGRLRVAIASKERRRAN